MYKQISTCKLVHKIVAKEILVCSNLNTLIICISPFPDFFNTEPTPPSCEEKGQLVTINQFLGCESAVLKMTLCIIIQVAYIRFTATLY